MSLDSDAPFPFYADLKGIPLQAGSVYFGEAGQNPTTNPITVYWDEAGTQPAAQPIPVSNGMTTRNGTPARLWMSADAYSRLVLDSRGRQVLYEATPPSSLRVQLAASGGSAMVGFIQSGLGAVARLAQDKMRDIVALKDAGAVEDGATDDTNAWNRAIAWMNDGTHRAILLGGVSAVFGALTPITADGSALYSLAPTENVRVEQHTDNVVTFTITPVDPSLSRIGGVGLDNLTVWNTNTAPTGGTGISIIRADRLRASNIDVRNFYRGIYFEGGADQKWSNCTVGGPYAWGSFKAGSNCVSFHTANYGAVNEVPSEMFFSNINWKGAGPIYLDTALDIKAGDGLWFTGGHIGFASTQSLLLNPAGTGTVIDSVKFTAVYFDGNFGTTSNGITLAASSDGSVVNLDFIGCSVKLHGQHGIQMTGTGTVVGVRFNGGMVEQNGHWGALIGAQTNVSFISVDFLNNNFSNVAANCITATGTTYLRILGCTIRGGANVHPVGVEVDVTSVAPKVFDNLFEACTTPMALNSPTSSYSGNQLGGAFPTTTAAAALGVPQGFDSVKIVGDTGITSIAGAGIESAEVTLYFTGSPTVTRGNNIALTTAGGDMVCTPGSVLVLQNDGLVWREVSRAVA